MSSVPPPTPEPAVPLPAEHPERTGEDGKAALRRRAVAVRRAREAAEVDAARDAVDRAVGTLLQGIPGGAAAICSYLPLRTEPLGRRTSDRLVAAGVRVLVPVTRPGAPLGWADHRPGLRPRSGPGGVPDPGEPLGETERDRALAGVGVVLVPALLADRSGTRLGRGGGHYDRSFALTPLGAVPLRAAVLFDDELVDDALPVEQHDTPVHVAVVPSGVVPLGPGR